MTKYERNGKLKDTISGLGAMDPQKFNENILDENWLWQQPKSRLVKALKIVAMRLSEDNTIEVKKSLLPDHSIDSGELRSASVSKFREVIVPAKSQFHSDGQTSYWELVIQPEDRSLQPMLISILGDFTIGRKRSGKLVDLDLTPYQASRFGVSGQHASVRVTSKGLYLLDLQSSNGTYHKGKRLRMGDAVELSQGDMIAFGKLVLLIVGIKHQSRNS